MRSRLLICAIFLSCHATTGLAQNNDTTLKSTTIEVIQSYKPEVKAQAKPEFKPDLPPRDTSRPAFRYDVPQQALYFTYSSLPLRPLALGKDSNRHPFANYLKLGGGTQSTFYADAGIGSISGRNYQTAVHLHHLSQKGNISNQQVSLTDLDATGSLKSQNQIWGMSVGALRNRYHFYGYDHDLYDLAKDSVQQTYSGVQLTVDVKNREQGSAGINYHPQIGAYLYGDAHDVSEQTLFFDLPVSKKLDENLTAGAGLNGTLTRLKTPAKSFDNNIFQINAFIAFSKNNFQGKIALYPTFNTAGNSFLLPDIKFAWKAPTGALMIAAGWQARLQQNSFRQLSTENPYIFDQYKTRQTRQDEVYASLHGAAGSHFSFDARLSWWQFDNLPMYLNDTLDQKNFYLLYDARVQAVSFDVSLHYQVADRMDVGLNGVITSFTNKTFNRVWHQPGLRIKGYLAARPAEHLTVTAYATLMDQIYALNALHEEVKLDGVYDLGLGAEYQIIPRLSVFANLNNLLNNRYQRWYGYEVIGFNVFGGLRLKF